MMKKLFSILIVVAFCFPVASVAQVGDVIELGDRREIFVDQYLLANMEGVELELHHPVDEAKVFTMGDCETLIGNEISRTVTWAGSNNLQPLAGKKVRLRIYLKDADLYSLRFRE